MLHVGGANHRTTRSRCLQLAAQLELAPPTGLREVIPAFESVLLDFETPPSAAEFSAWWETQHHRFAAPPTGTQNDANTRCHDISVCFDGADLPRVAASAQVTVAEVAGRFCAAEFQVQCLGFAPGFPYLNGLPTELQTPRLATPRTRIPAGSVAVGGEHAGIYPQASPGGWNLLGRTAERLFDPGAGNVAAMFRLRAGDRVRFFPRDHWPETRTETISAPLPPPGARPALRIIRSGWGIGLQDLGRFGFRRFGVPNSGAMDPGAARSANQVVGNPPDVPVLELCGPGHVLRSECDLWLGLAWVRSGTSWQATTVRLKAGEDFAVPADRTGALWSYLAVPGGFAGRRILGSASTHWRAGMGDALRSGDRVFGANATDPKWSTAIERRFLPVPRNNELPLRIWRGPQWSLFTDHARESFFETSWTVSTQSDRVGYRLDGPPVPVPMTELISEPVLPGTVQLPPNGQPIVTMPDGPTLGGYPKLGLVDPADLPRLAQSPPGTRLRFVLHQ